VIPAKGYQAVFSVDGKPGDYVACEVLAWDADGSAMCAERRGLLVQVREHPAFVSLLTSPPGDRSGDYERWFRGCTGIEPDAPLNRRDLGSGAFAYALLRPFVPEVK
jgi:hypothetical protein